MRTSLKDEITSELKSLLADSQKEILRLLKAKTNTNVREETDEDTENETRSFYTPTKSVRINATQNIDPCSSRNSNLPMGGSKNPENTMRVHNVLISNNFIVLNVASQIGDGTGLPDPYFCHFIYYSSNKTYLC